MKHDLILHIIRNPYGWADDEVRNARLVAAALIEQQGNQLEQAQKRIDELERLNLTFAQNEQQVLALRGFARAIMGYWPDQNEIPGDELQDIAEAHGLLKPETRTEACGENCACDEYGDFPATCYRKTDLLTGQ